MRNRLGIFIASVIALPACGSSTKKTESSSNSEAKTFPFPWMGSRFVEQRDLTGPLGDFKTFKISAWFGDRDNQHFTIVKTLGGTNVLAFVNVYGSYTVSEPFQTGGKGKWDWTVSTAKVSMATSTSVEYANRTSLCGESDWKLDEAKDLKGSKCSVLERFDDVNYFDTFSYQASGTLQFGVYKNDGETGLSGDKRAQEVEEFFWK